MDANENKKLPQPYLNEFYNIHRFTDQENSPTVAGRVVNALIAGLNERHKLPRFLLVVVDTDIISDFDIFKLDIVKSIRQSTSWMVKQINIQIRRKRLELIAQKPGNIYGSDPTVIFVRALHRANLAFHRGSYLDELFALKAKFNDALNDAVARIDERILTINSCNTSSHFNHLGKLSIKGKYSFWHEINDLAERFDQKAVKLLPNPNTRSSQVRINQVFNSY